VKKHLLKLSSLLMAVALLNIQLMANPIAMAAISENEINSVANFDESEIYAAFSEIETLENLVKNSEYSYNEVKEMNNELISNISVSSAIALSSSENTPPIFGAFLWGCLFNWVGMLIVGLTTDFDNQQITKSFWGCLINSLLFGGGTGCSFYYGYL